MFRSVIVGLFLLFLSFSFLTPLTAQLRGGFVGSMNSSALRGNYDAAQDVDRVRRNTLGLGILGIAQFTRNIGVELSASIVERGGENGSRGADFRETRLVYAEFPLLLKISAKYPYAIAGGYFSSLLTAEILADEGDEVKPVKNVFSLGDSGWMLGVGTNVYASETTHFHLEMIYSKGTRELLFSAADGESLKNSALHFRLGFTFTLLDWRSDKE